MSHRDELEIDSTSYIGDFAKMMEERAKEYPKLRRDLDKLLGSWEGQLICVMVVDEDENGETEGVNIMLSGVSPLTSSLALTERLEKVSKELKQKTIKDAVSEMLDELTNQLDAIDEILKEGEKR